MQIPKSLGPIHIVGIGGIGMSAIAEVLLAQGYRVQGSDLKDSANCQRLRAKGIRVAVGHAVENLVDAAFVVVSTAVKPGNPELDGARARGLPVIRRAEILAEIMRAFATISVTGTHGKTTTTSLIAHLLTAGRLDPTVITGGIINEWGSNARLGRGPWMVVEADESDGTFVRIPTQIGVVTNIDPEHLDYFGTVENMHREFAQFFTQIPFYGLAVACIDHPVAKKMIADLGLRRDGRRLLTYGTDPDADLRLTRVAVKGSMTTFDAELSARVTGGARSITGWQMPVPGHHNALNALSAIAVASETGMSDAATQSAMASFSGVKRRFQPTGTWNGATIYDDYGHHPVEIAAVLKAARAGAQGGRVIAICEPHRYTRLRDLMAEFAACFVDADSVIIGPLYAAGERPIDSVSHAALAAAVRATGHVDATHVDAPEALVPALKQRARSGDIVLCFGAGHSTEWAHALPAWLADAT
jgi:UDP-N-acetylmuramate--alanine ligase